jgi:excinuclease UvrABC ATPase subunit
MCSRCEGMGSVNDIDLSQLFDETKTLNEGALTVPGFTSDGWHVRIMAGAGLDPTNGSLTTATKSARSCSTPSR